MNKYFVRNLQRPLYYGFRLRVVWLMHIVLCLYPETHRQEYIYIVGDTIRVLWDDHETIELLWK